MPGRCIEFFFDVGSPYSYLAATQMERVGARAGLPVRWRPFLLGGVFRATGNEMPARVPAKARYMIDDLTRWARHYGVPLRIPSRFPVVTLRPQRALVHVETTAPHALATAAMELFRAYWAEDLDPTSDAVLARAADVAGLPRDELLAAIEAQPVKDALRATTEEAVARGAFGAPTMFVGDAMFWGNDRLELLVESVRAS
ncbi:MAG: 2-hydroxychromene-2-carboxylate isomerase [Myxococcota bacterium]|nr:2-hydroxychromene-2-carboxylate isomerase [Myxococcota bacterium]MDW8363476.1 2-hydroxychromene-2-carboxylate isomerase [Myxococcales bacterium]